jgi:hypothetical protein
VPLRYIQHFGLDFLFIRGDHFVIQGPPVGGQFHWYEMPLMIFGAIGVLRRFTTSASLRTVAAFVVAYPISDSLGWGLLSIHALRSAPGLCALVLLSAVGFIAAVRWLWKQNPHDARTAIIVFAALVIALNARFFYHFYGEYNRRPEVYHPYHVDLLQACEWLKPRFDDFDAIYITTNDFTMPYVITTVALGYDPKRWFSEPIEIAKTPPNGVENPCEWDFYTRYGKMHFIYDYSAFSFVELQKKFAPGRILLIVRPDEYTALLDFEELERPGEFKLENPTEHIIHKIYDPDGNGALWLCKL